MAEKIISPGVFTKEVDQTFLPAAISDIGAAVIGPAVKGPALVPTIVSSYSEYQSLFGDSFKSGSNYYQYLTSHTAENYLKNSSQMTVVRILDGTFGPATVDVGNSGDAATATITITDGDLATANQFTEGEFVKMTATDGTAGVYVLSDLSETGASADGTVLTTGDDIGIGTLPAGTAALGTCIAIGVNLNTNSQATVLNAIKDGLQSTNSPLKNKITGTTAGTGDGNQSSVFTQASGGSAGNTTITTDISQITQGTSFDFSGGGNAFTLETLADGAIMNNADSASRTNNILISGSTHNLRFEVSSLNEKRGTFTLLIRKGDDSVKRKQILETFNNISLDANSNNYINKIIGDQTLTIRGGGTTDPYLQLSGSYARKSNYVRVKTVLTPTIDYLDENGNVRVPANSGSLPKVGSGSSNGGFSGGTNGYAGFDALGNVVGTNKTKYNFYDEINSTNQQGFTMAANQGKTAYDDALNLLSNQDEYDINMILIPGILDNLTNHGAIISKAIDVCEDRGDCFVIVDPVEYASTLATATTRGDARDSNYAAMYWPWIQVPDNQVGTNRWVPPSVVLGGIFAFNDKVAHPWFAPAGLNRGGIDTAIQAERKLTNSNRDTLYESNINPIATFPGQGVTVFGQKTLQKKASSLDRINVRRLLIALKKFIASSSRFLVFEQNNTATRRRFLNIVNPYLEQVQSNSGLTAFKVVMDGSNNTPDVVDRNILYGQIFVQPTRTAEFIVLDFTVQPTGATFPE